MTLVSIVTATLNRLDMLKEAVASVRAQSVGQIEHLIADGGSTDGTLEWVMRQPDLTLLAGPDRGVYDAWNRSIALAKGDVIGLLNSDDLYFPDAISRALCRLAREPQTDAVAGAGVLVEGEAVVRRYIRPTEVVGDLRTLFLGHVGINAHFFRRRCMKQLGEFSLNYPLVSDRDLMIRFADRGFKTSALGGYVYRYRRHDRSLTFDRALERQDSLRRELLTLARAWQTDAAASAEAHRLARVLEGRSRIGLARLAVKRRDRSLLSDALARDSTSNGGLSIGVLAAVAVDYLAHGR